MEDAKGENLLLKEDGAKKKLLELLKRAKAMDENLDDHQGMIIGSRLSKISDDEID